PPCRPIIYHDIQEFDELSTRQTVEQSYNLWLSILITSFTGRYSAGDNLSYFRWFFLVTLLDIIFGVFIGIGWVFGGGGGLIEMVTNFKAIHEKGAIAIVAGVFNAVCATLVFAQVVMHIMLWRRVYAYIESKGWTLLPGK
ncbi:967_t:CDS:2, partial [Dentiscutata heterogama]